MKIPKAWQDQAALDAAFDRLCKNWPAVSALYMAQARASLARPKRFELWECYAFGCLARAHYTVESIFELGDREPDCGVLTRVLYEHVVAFAWLMIDPQAHYAQLASWEQKERKKMSDDLARFSSEPWDQAEVDRAIVAIGFDPNAKIAPETFDRTVAADKFWRGKIPGWTFQFRPNYANLFRPLSTYVHPTAAGLMSFFSNEPGFDPASPARQHMVKLPAQALAMFTDALIIAAATSGFAKVESVIATVFADMEQELLGDEFSMEDQ